VSEVASGTIIGRDFRVVRHLSSGAMGAVYLVEQLSTGKERAMKLMSAELVRSDKARERFVLEARIGAKIDSDHVVEVVTAGIDEPTGMPYLVMELLKGEDVADLVDRRGALPLSDVREIFRQLGHALEKAHAQGIVHRDLKPENLFIAESRRDGVPFTVKILDFGIAKLVAEGTAGATQAIGTPLFMAPEQTDRQGAITPAADVWPLGLIAFFLLTGHYYWHGAHAGLTQLLREVVIEELVPASQRADEHGAEGRLPAGFDEWFARCVSRQPGERFAEAGAATRAFQALAGGSTVVVTSSATHRVPDLEVGDTVAAGELETQAALLRSGAHEARTTGLTAASTLPVEGRSRWPLLALFVLVAGGGAGAFVAMRDDGASALPSPAAPAPSSAPAPVASAAPAGCPEGMKLITAGRMFMGSSDADLEADVRPPHRVTVSSFCLDEREVTAGAYQACIDSGNCLRTQTTIEFAGMSPEELTAYGELCNAGKPDRANHPANCVDWTMADTYCKIDGGRLPQGGARLPTEAEWEYAARGSGQRTYPWGDEAPGPDRLNACGSECTSWIEERKLRSSGRMYDGDDGFAGTAPVGSFKRGAASSGVLDLAGNVWEWTADWYGPYGSENQEDPKGPASGEARVVRGGGFNGMVSAWAKPAYRWKTNPAFRSHGIGFRCAAPAP
jgi:formylglycine-generating enzyme required for sulfatase activity/tRNA A-37 threonylcarbamoyl transferase component Bud32